MSPRRRTTALLLALLAGPVFAPPTAPAAPAPEYTIDSTRSLFAVLTHKAGIASGLAHDHLVVAGRRRPGSLSIPQPPRRRASPSPPPSTRWRSTPPGRARRGRGASTSSESTPASCRRSPTPTARKCGPRCWARASSTARRSRRSGRRSWRSRAARPASGWVAKLQLTIHGKTVERSLPATWSETEGTLTAEIWGEFRFQEFGIEPYSTMLGAIRNDDRFHLYVSVVARRAP